MQDIKKSVYKETIETIEMETRKSSLKSMSEADLLERYNRRNTLRIFGIPDDKSRSDNVQRNFKECNRNIGKDLIVAKNTSAIFEKSDLSFAHRLPGRNSNARLNILRFCRQVSNLEIPKKKLASISIDEPNLVFWRPDTAATEVFQS